MPEESPKKPLDELTFDELADLTIAEVARLRQLPYNDDTRLSVLRGMLLHFGGFKPNEVITVERD